MQYIKFIANGSKLRDILFINNFYYIYLPKSTIQHTDEQSQSSTFADVQAFNVTHKLMYMLIWSRQKFRGSNDHVEILNST